ncbi:MAG: 4Fe-4S dicluster domain-containing protein [Candidatus Omnitrophica bacterium]|nr:4Fe-4S dicluster domain-containing protein [Candidatus Omnitrophota bacterium]
MSHEENTNEPKDKISRRDFLKRSAVVASGAASLIAAMSPLRLLDEKITAEEFVQKHYKEMTKEEMDKVIARITKKVNTRYGINANLRDIKPMDGVEYVYALNLSRCNGSRRCVHACVNENNQSRSPEIQYISVLKMPKGTFDMEQGTRQYNPTEVPEEDSYYLPVQCQQCENPPCVKACPVEATWQEKDGITVIDYNWCIGCRYCEAACPYWARRFNFAEPNIPQERVNPNMGYLSNRPRPKGVVEKCHFCLHQTREGKLPACLEACPTGARIFGNILDPNSEVSYVLKNKRVFVLKEEAGTLPRFFYFFDK